MQCPRCDKTVKSENHYCVPSERFKREQEEARKREEEARKTLEAQRLANRPTAPLFEEGGLAELQGVRVAVVAVVHCPEISSAEAKHRHFVGLWQFCGVVGPGGARVEEPSEDTVPEICRDRFRALGPAERRRVRWVHNDDLVPIDALDCSGLLFETLPKPFLLRLLLSMSLYDAFRLALASTFCLDLWNQDIHWKQRYFQLTGVSMDDLLVQGVPPREAFFQRFLWTIHFYVVMPRQRGIKEPSFSVCVNPDSSIESFIRTVHAHPIALQCRARTLQVFDPRGVELDGEPDGEFDQEASSVGTSGLFDGIKMQVYQSRFLD